MPEPGNINEYVASLLGYSELSEKITSHREIPGSGADFSKLEKPLPESLETALENYGISELFTHQARAINHIRNGKNTVVATPTASGKTLIYNIPVFEKVLENPGARALYLFPLKALAQDQLKNLKKLSSGLPGPVTAEIYDGDTTAYRRRKIRAYPPNILLTNPEMLHLSILPYHEKWSDFIKGLRVVVVDEVHTCRGITGSHMAWVLRRLIRICGFYGVTPTFVFCSATVSNPGELAEKLTGLPVEQVTRSGAPVAGKHFIMLSGMEKSARCAILLLHAALHRNLRTIIYTRSRNMTELISMWASQRAGSFSGRISAYRSGFLPEERREIERKLSSGELLAVVSTSALEMGIDIGELDLCILVGYPGSVMATWQRAGRVGRRDRDSAVVFIGRDDPLDQYMMNAPDSFYDMPPETAVVNPYNPVIMKRHLECAAREWPLKADEEFIRSSPAEDALKEMTLEGKLFLDAEGVVYEGLRTYPHRRVPLRGTGETIEIFSRESGKGIGSMDSFRAIFEAYPGAVYLHRGRHFLVEKLDLENARATAREAKMPFFTRTRSEKVTEILEIRDRRAVLGTTFCFGRLRITETVKGYEKRQVGRSRFMGFVPLSLPPQVFETEGFWFPVSGDVMRSVSQRGMNSLGGIHALEHAAIAILPLLVMCDRQDIGGLSTPFHPQTGLSTIFVYDGFPGGVGLAREAFFRGESVLEHALKVIRDCDCDSGCPACVQSPKCGSGNQPLDKAGARLMLEQLSRPIDGPLSLMPDPFALGVKPAGPSRGKVPAGQNLKYGVLDLETRRSAEDVGGWHRAGRMGISCSVLFDSGRDEFLVYEEEETPLLIERMRSLDLIVGFNVSRFDYMVMQGVCPFDPAMFETLDLLSRIKDVLGYRLSLDHVAKHTLGARKSADGLMALKWWKEGKYDRIVEYCKQDVAVTRDLYLHGRDKGHLLFQNKAMKTLRIPADWGPA